MGPESELIIAAGLQSHQRTTTHYRLERTNGAAFSNCLLAH